jgi:Bacterial PH domain
LHATYRPSFGRALTVAIGAICAIGIVVLTAQEGLRGFLQATPWFALGGGVCWALFWRPRVDVSDGGVRIVNVLRTIDIPWPAIQLVDTKWALTVVTAYGRFTAWAAPSPGARGAMRSSRADVRHLPSSTFGGTGIRPGDLPSSHSGATAELIRRHWEQLRDAGHLHNPRLEHEKVPVTWHIPIIAAGATILALGVLGLVI